MERDTITIHINCYTVVLYFVSSKFFCNLLPPSLLGPRCFTYSFEKILLSFFSYYVNVGSPPVSWSRLTKFHLLTLGSKTDGRNGAELFDIQICFSWLSYKPHKATKTLQKMQYFKRKNWIIKLGEKVSIVIKTFASPFYSSQSRYFMKKIFHLQIWQSQKLKTRYSLMF